MDMFNPMEDPREEIDPLTGQPRMPNVPRDPDNPREKLMSYLSAKMESDKKMMTPEYRQQMRAPTNALMDNSRDLALANVFLNAANQAGSIDGKIASSAGTDMAFKNLQGLNQQAMQGIDRERSDMQGAEDQRGKMLQYLAEKYDKREALTDKAKKDERDYRLRERSVAAQERAATNKADAGANKGFQAVDSDFAKDYNDWQGTGKAEYQKNVSLLQSAKEKLSKLQDSSMISGNVVGRLPNVMRPEEARVIESEVKAAAQGAMKAALGTNFTEGEGKRIMDLAYDPTLSPKANLAKIEAAIADIKNKAEITEQKARYFEKGGTLKGFTDPRALNATPKKDTSAAGGGLTPEEQAELDELEKLYGGQ